MNCRGETKLIFPGLAGFYASMAPIADTLVRVVVGIMFLVHVSGQIQSRRRRGRGQLHGKERPRAGLVFAYAAMVLELVGGVCLIIGLFTRFFAAALAIEMADRLDRSSIFRRVMPPARGGYEYVLLDRRRFARDRHARRRTLFGRPHDRQGTLRTQHALKRARLHAARALRIQTLLSWNAAPP